MSLQTRIVLATLSFFNALLLLALGFGSVAFVNGAAGTILAVGFWVFAGVLFALARRLRKGTEWRLGDTARRRRRNGRDRRLTPERRARVSGGVIHRQAAGQRA